MQDASIFSGSLAYNLDPFGQFSEARMWEALEQAHLKECVRSLPEGLQYSCSDGGTLLR